MSITAALPLIHQSDKLHEFDCNTVMEALIFNNKENLSSLNCGKVETNNTTRTKHFSWDAQVEIGNKTSAGIFISPKAVLTSKLGGNNLQQKHAIFNFNVIRCNML